jgi:hypothetical protein
MLDKLNRVVIVAAAMLAITSPAFAQTFDPVRTGPRAARFSGLYAFVPGRVGRVIVAAPRGAVTVDRNDPALTGGGSLGYNETVERGA